MIITRRLCAVALSVALLAGLPGCTAMLETRVLTDADAPGACLNAAGAYFLPKKLLTVQVLGLTEQVAGQPPNPLRGYGIDIQDDWKSVADREQGYCLDYLGSVTSRDEIGIARTPDGLLQRVYSRAQDKSVEIAKVLIDTAFLGGAAAGRQGLLKGTKEYAGPFTFDPFDPYDAAKINAALRPFGYCVFVEGLSFPLGVPPASWCESPKVLTMVATKAPPLVDALPPVEVSRRGVLYRPNVTRTLTVMRKADPYGRDPWLLTMTKQVEVPNRAPVFVVEVNRSFFVDRVTDLEFKDGVLTNVSVKKPSEAAAFVEIPLAIASAIVALPGTIVKLKINDAQNQERLIRANTELIAIRRRHRNDIEALVAKHGPGSTAGLTLTPDNRSIADPRLRSVYRDNCLLTGRDADECEP
jgi:hypothetical protein